MLGFEENLSNEIFPSEIFTFEEMSFYALNYMILSVAFTTISRKGSANGVPLMENAISQRAFH